MINLAVPTTKRTESFVSYVDCEAQTSSSNRQGNSEELKFSENFLLLPGEREIATACSRVIAYRPCTQNRQGILGSLRCTNLRLIFTPFLETEDNSKPLNLKKLGDSRYQTPLLNIFALHYTSTSDQKRFKPLQECLTHSDQVSMVKILCKLLNALLLKPHFKTLDGILTTSSEIMGYNFSALQYDYCWEVELNRLNVNPNSFRITSLNLNSKRIKSYPQTFVVPYTWEDNTILKHILVWNECRIPVWCFSLKNGSALLRSARLVTASEIAERCVQHFEYTLQQTQNSFDKEVRFIKLSRLNAKDISQSYECLRKLCSIDSVEDFWTLDVRWNTELERTNWLLLISKCLEYTNEVVRLMNEENYCVVLEETNNDDAACIISSLVQLCLDANFRTIDGLVDLLRKEWSVLGHKFAEKHYGINNSEITPSFLLFLDCVHQLIDQNHVQFQFSQYFLIGLWDLALSGLHPIFLGGIYQNPNFSDLFHREILELFPNPSYNDYDINHQNLRIKFTIPNLNFWIDNFLRYLAPCQILRGGEIQSYIERQNLATIIQRDYDPQILTFDQNLSRNITSAYPYCNETPPPVPELLYALPAIKLRSQIATKSSPRSQLELSPKTSAINIRRLSLAASTKQYAARPASFYMPHEPDASWTARFTAVSAKSNLLRPTLNTGVIDNQGRKVRNHVMLNDEDANVVIVKLDTLV
uniref:Myotubularin phosphatase domain-containing protein n=1 Tax=Romanomermis culicivorax TaxID=13658 RepID=A0A915HEN0_ROMCU